MTEPAYTPVADAIDALADRVAAADLSHSFSLGAMAAVFDVLAKAAECYDVEVAVRIEHEAKGLRARAAPLRAPTRGECGALASYLRHQAVFVRHAEATQAKRRPAAAPVLDFSAARIKRRDAEADARRQRTQRIVDRYTGWPRPDCGPDGGDAA